MGAAVTEQTYSYAALQDAAKKAYAAGAIEDAKKLFGMMQGLKAQGAGMDRPAPGQDPADWKRDRIEAAKSGQIKGPEPRSPERLDIERQIQNLGILSPEVQFKLGRLGDKDFAEAIMPGFGEALGRGGAQGLSFGFADEGLAGLRSALGGPDYDRALAEQRLMDDVSRYARPKTMLAGEIAGSVAVPGGAALKLGKGASLAKKAAIGSATGATTGSVYNFGSGEGGVDNRLSNAASGAVLGGTLGGAGPVVGRIIGAGAQKLADSSAGKAALKLAPTVDDLRAAAGRIFANAENTPIGDGAMLTGAQRVLADLERGGMSRPDGLIPANAPKALAAANALEDVVTRPGGITFGKLDSVRAMAQGAADAADPLERKLGMQAVEGIDDIIDTVLPETGKNVSEARAMWGQLRRSEKIGEAIRRAGDHPSGFAQGIATELRNILRNPKRLAGFSEQEQKAMRALTGRMNVNSIAAGLGKMAPRFSGYHNIAGSGINATMSTLIGGPGLAAANMAGATAARLFADRSAAKKAEIVRSLVAMGGAAPKASTKGAKVTDQIVNRLFGGMAASGQSLPDMQLPPRQNRW